MKAFTGRRFLVSIIIWNSNWVPPVREARGVPGCRERVSRGFASSKNRCGSCVSHSMYEGFKYNCASWSQHSDWFRYRKTTHWSAHSYILSQAVFRIGSYTKEVWFWMSCSLAITLFGNSVISQDEMQILWFVLSFFFFLSHLALLLTTCKEYHASPTGEGEPEQLPTLSVGLIPKMWNKKASSKPLGLNTLRKYVMRNSSHR